MLKKFSLLPLLLAALLLLSGCYKVDAEVTFTEEDTATASGTLAFPAKLPKGQYQAGVKQMKQRLPKGTKLEDFKEEGLKGKSFTTGPTAVTELFPEDSGLKYTHLGDVYTVEVAGDITEDFLRQQFPQATTDPSWTLKLTFPVAVAEATEGIEIAGNSATVPSEVLLSGEPWKVAASPAGSKEVTEVAAPEAPVVQGPRSPYPAYLFTALILIGASLFVGGRYMNFKSAANGAGKPAKAKKPKKAKKS